MGWLRFCGVVLICRGFGFSIRSWGLCCESRLVCVFAGGVSGVHSVDGFGGGFVVWLSFQVCLSKRLPCILLLYIVYIYNTYI